MTTKEKKQKETDAVSGDSVKDDERTREESTSAPENARDRESGKSSKKRSSSETASPVKHSKAKVTSQETTNEQDDEIDSSAAAAAAAETLGESPSEEQTNDKSTGSPINPSIASRPVKRARTAYFIFADEKRAELQKQVCDHRVCYKRIFICRNASNNQPNCSTKGKGSLPWLAPWGIFGVACRPKKN